MDIEYLLYLQQFRETVGSILTPLMNAVTKLSAGFLPIAMMCMIYWAFDRKAGRKILAGLGGGLFINGFLKLTFCVYRPWIRDTRILPYGDSKNSSYRIFISKWAYNAGNGYVRWKWTLVHGKKAQCRCRSVVCAGIPDYVFTKLSGSTYSAGCSGGIYINSSYDVSDRVVGIVEMKRKKRDLMILVAGLLICIAAVLYYEYKPYPLDYLPDGSLLVDPAKMRGDAYEGVGFYCILCHLQDTGKKTIRF